LAQTRAAEQWRERLARAAAGLEARSPLATLARGYAIVSRESDGAIVRHPAEAPPGTVIAARLAQGGLRAVVQQEQPASVPRRPQRAVRAKHGPLD
jgi:exodeoxyribonuclease VII large subunit